jgi:hypothetical protein
LQSDERRKCSVLTHYAYGGWHSGATGDDGFLSHVCHSGDGESHTGWGERFEHPTKTWVCATQKQFTMQAQWRSGAVAVAIAKCGGGASNKSSPDLFDLRSFTVSPWVPGYPR